MRLVTGKDIFDHHSGEFFSYGGHHAESDLFLRVERNPLSKPHHFWECDQCVYQYGSGRLIFVGLRGLKGTDWRKRGYLTSYMHRRNILGKVT